MRAATTIQSLLEVMYRVDGPHPVGAFGVPRCFIESLLGEERAATKREAFLVQSHEDGADLGVFIEDEILSAAEEMLEVAQAGAALSATSPAGLDALCAALEGVSHFLYFTFCGACMDRPVSQLELEVQAEIDKYLALTLLFPGDRGALVGRLFDAIAFLPDLSPAEYERYAVANRMGRRYALWFARRWQKGQAHDAWRDARSLYRMPWSHKAERIAAT